MTGAVKSFTTNLSLRKLYFNFPNWGDDANANMDILDAALGALGLAEIAGIWDNSVAYLIGDKLIDDILGSIWVCAVNHTSAASGTFAADRVLHPTYWEPFGFSGTDILPTVDDVSSVGTASHNFDYIYLNSGINFNNGDVTIIATANRLDISGGNYFWAGSMAPAVAGASDLGALSDGWGNLFLHTGGTINWNNSDVVVTHSANTLAFTGASVGYTFDAPLSATTVTATAQLVISGASAGQIVFPATQNASANANTFDDYEEGTYTPLVAGQSTPGAGTYTFQDGRYTKIGNRVLFSARCTMSAHTGTGTMIMTVPFSSGLGAIHPVAVVVSTLTFANQLFAYVEANQNYILFATAATGGATGFVTVDGVCDLVASGQYNV